MRDCFSSYHPGVSALYFAIVLAVIVTTFHPILLLVALGVGLGWCAQLGAGFKPKTLLILFVAAAAFNPLFSHAGVTILTWLPSGNPLTLESIFYGLGAGGMLVCALVWLSCLARVMTADKWMCLLGRPLPSLSLMLSMTLRALPRLRTRQAQLKAAQRQIGRSGQGGLDRARVAVRRLSVLALWSLEEGITTADSMDSRGYGLPHTTSYTNYRLDHRDTQLLAFLGCAGAYLLLMALRGALSWRYYPSLAWAGLSLWSLSAYIAWGCLCAVPLYLNWKEGQLWTHTG